MPAPKFIHIDGKRFLWHELLQRAAASSWRLRQG